MSRHERWLQRSVAEGFTLSLAKQALSGDMDDVITTIKRNVRLA